MTALAGALNVLHYVVRPDCSTKWLAFCSAMLEGNTHLARQGLRVFLKALKRLKNEVWPPLAPTNTPSPATTAHISKTLLHSHTQNLQVQASGSLTCGSPWSYPDCWCRRGMVFWRHDRGAITFTNTWHASLYENQKPNRSDFTYVGGNYLYVEKNITSGTVRNGHLIWSNLSMKNNR